MPDDKSVSRGPDGSPRDQSGLVGPQGSAPASPRDLLIGHFEFALDAFRDNESEGWCLNTRSSPLKEPFGLGARRTPLVRPPGPSLGRPPVVEGDAQTLLDLRAVNPGSDCRVLFERSIKVSDQRARIRYQKADAWIAELKASRASSSGKSF